MSYALYPAAWACKAVGGLEKLVLLRLVEHANDRGQSIRPGVRSVADACGLSQRKVQYAMRSLEEAGVLVLDREADATAKLPRVYRLDLERLKRGQKSTSDGVKQTGAQNAPVHRTTLTGAQYARHRCTACTQISHMNQS
jgi:hypothetical protein